MNEFKYADFGKAKCLECGNRLPGSGRSDRKFCSDSCKDHYHNRIKHKNDREKNFVKECLNRNYHILHAVLDSDKSEISLINAVNHGFNSNFITSYVKIGRYIQFCCYNISFMISDAKIFNIKKITLNLCAKNQSK